MIGKLSAGARDHLAYTLLQLPHTPQSPDAKELTPIKVSGLEAFLKQVRDFSISFCSLSLTILAL